MIYRIGADAVALIHFAFVAFVALGSLLVVRWRSVMWVQIPAAIWGAWIEFSGGICPLTPLENSLRQLGGERGYSGGFVDHYLLPLIYPSGLSRQTQLALGTAVLVINAVVYGWVFIAGPAFAKRKSSEG